MKKPSPEQRHLLEQTKQIALGLSATFAPFCEIVVHNLLNPQHSIEAIHNNLSGRTLGGPATELGIERLADPNCPPVIANYSNQFADGRQVKSTSIGIKDSHGNYFATLCLNVDLTLFQGLESVLRQFSAVGADPLVDESLDPANATAIRARIDQFAAKLSTTPRELRTADRRKLMRELKQGGVFEIRRSVETIANRLGVSRATIYNDVK
jgi:predicted transcriptional regulator YheO